MRYGDHAALKPHLDVPHPTHCLPGTEFYAARTGEGENITAFSAAISNERRTSAPWAERTSVSSPGTMQMEPDIPLTVPSVFLALWSRRETYRLSFRMY